MKKIRSAGFTLIEMTITMAIIASLSVAALQLNKMADTDQTLTVAALETKNFLRLAQTLALAPVEPDEQKKVICGYLFETESDNTLKISTVFSKNDDIIECYQLSTNDALSCSGKASCEEYESKQLENDISIESNESVFFQSPYSEVSNGLDIQIQKSNGHTKTITINQSGKINIMRE